jgi:hypothetical protein
MPRFQISSTFMVLGLGTLIAVAVRPALAQTSGSQAPAGAPTEGPAAESGKSKPAAADGGAPKVAKKAKKSKAKAEPAAAADPPVPPGTASAAETARPPATTKGKPAAASGKPAAGSAAATAPAKLAGTPSAPAKPATTAVPAPAPGTAGTPKPAAAAPAAAAKSTGPKCSLEDPEQPRGGRLDVLGTNFGTSPLVRVAGKPVRMIERREDRISVQVPADSDGGPVAVQAQGVVQPCGTLVIIGKNR